MLFPLIDQRYRIILWEEFPFCLFFKKKIHSFHLYRHVLSHVLTFRGSGSEAMLSTVDFSFVGYDLEDTDWRCAGVIRLTEEERDDPCSGEQPTLKASAQGEGVRNLHYRFPWEGSP